MSKHGHDKNFGRDAVPIPTFGNPNYVFAAPVQSPDTSASTDVDPTVLTGSNNVITTGGFVALPPIPSRDSWCPSRPFERSDPGDSHERRRHIGDCCGHELHLHVCQQFHRMDRESYFLSEGRMLHVQ